MPKEDWGVKRLCPHCASRFYDLKKDPMICPICTNTFTADSLTAGRGRTMIAEKASVRERDLEVDDLAEDDDIDADAGDVDLDDDLLEDDDDDNVSLDEIADVSAPDDEH